jgi:hypothetical protein
MVVGARTVLALELGLRRQGMRLETANLGFELWDEDGNDGRMKELKVNTIRQG